MIKHISENINSMIVYFYIDTEISLTVWASAYA